MSTKLDKDLVEFFKVARDEVYREWSRSAFEMLGSRLQRALIAERILYLAAQQSAMIGADMVQRIVDAGRIWITDQTETI